MPEHPAEDDAEVSYVEPEDDYWLDADDYYGALDLDEADPDELTHGPVETVHLPGDEVDE